MPRISVRTKTALAVALLVLPAGASAQTYKVDKYDIGGPGGTDYLSADPVTGRVYISRATHVMVVDGATGKVVGDIPETPRVHGIAFAPKYNHGFTTNAGDSTVTMFDTKTLAVIKKIHAGTDGLDGIMYDDATDRIFSINHSHPMGSVVAIDANTGDVVGTATLSGRAPEGGASDGQALRQHRGQELHRRSRREDPQGDRQPADRALRRSHGHRAGSRVEPHLRRLQQDVGRRRRGVGQSDLADREW
jgi:hypothetical protein